jgi:hypothetical protein
MFLILPIASVLVGVYLTFFLGVLIVQGEGALLASDSKKLLKNQVLLYFLVSFSFHPNLLLRLIISHPA